MSKANWTPVDFAKDQLKEAERDVERALIQLERKRKDYLRAKGFSDFIDKDIKQIIAKLLLSAKGHSMDEAKLFDAVVERGGTCGGVSNPRTQFDRSVSALLNTKSWLKRDKDKLLIVEGKEDLAWEAYSGPSQARRGTIFALIRSQSLIERD